jgi:hypothetical protein
VGWLLRKFKANEKDRQGFFSSSLPKQIESVSVASQRDNTAGIEFDQK